MKRPTHVLLGSLYRAGSHNRPSRAMGRLADARLPKPVLDRLIATYARAYRVDLSEAVPPDGGWRTFDQFFTRELRPGARPLDPSPSVLSSPCDGRVQSSGVIQSGTLLQAKGRAYSLGELLGDDALAPRFEGGRYVTIYLSPRDYHRVHHPFDGVVTGWRHVPGVLYTVAPRATAVVDRLFARNERLSTLLRGAQGDAALVMVGATGVGRITVSYCEACTNRGRPCGDGSFDPPLPVRKGDELGRFHLGSTVVLVLAPGAWVDLVPEPGTPVRLGQTLYRLP